VLSDTQKLLPMMTVEMRDYQLKVDAKSSTTHLVPLSVNPKPYNPTP